VKYSNIIKEDIEKYSALKIIDAKKMYREKFNHIPELAFYKTLSRMADNDEIKRITKGIYCKPKVSRFGTVISSEKEIMEYFLGEKKNKGVVIGYQLFYKYRLTTQVSKAIEMYSNIVVQEKRVVGSVTVYKIDIRLDTKLIKMIELMEILQGYRGIEELNFMNLIKFVESAVHQFDEKTVDKIVKSIKYKKRTLASLKNVLDYYKIDNSIDKYLNGTSKYDAIIMEELYESAQQR
jgi:hypothetical protein